MGPIRAHLLRRSLGKQGRAESRSGGSRRRVEPGRELPEELSKDKGSWQADEDPARRLADHGGDFEQPQAQGVELGPAELEGVLRDLKAQCMHEPIGSGMQQ